MSYQPSEIADLILLIALGPVIVVSLRRVLPYIPRTAFWALGAMLCGYVFTIAEGFALPDLFNMIEHIAYAVAGIAFLLMALQFARVLSAGSRGQR
jgi:hypothetical protein